MVFSIERTNFKPPSLVPLSKLLPLFDPPFPPSPRLHPPLSPPQGIVRQDGTGFATFKVAYQAIVCRPYKGEVLDAVVTSVNKMGFFAEAGPLQIFVSNHVSSPHSVWRAVRLHMAHSTWCACGVGAHVVHQFMVCMRHVVPLALWLP